jgi:hypothetical protein
MDCNTQGCELTADETPIYQLGCKISILTLLRHALGD